MNSSKPVPFETIIAALIDESKPFPARYLNHFSDLEQEQIGDLEEIWDSISDKRRRALFQDLNQLSEADTLLSFDSVGRMALKDKDPQVRFLAISVLWECAATDLIPVLIELMETDPDNLVRGIAANALGQYVYYGELEEIPEKDLHRVEESLLKTIADAPAPLIQQKALESLGYSSRPEVPGLIKSSYQKGDRNWLASALCAMGRSADGPLWERMVLPMLDHDNPSVRVEAVRAAGELELKKARDALLDMIRKDDDDDVIGAAIWSLSQIGGEGVREALEQLYENADDDDIADFIQDALDNLEFTDGFDPLLFEIDIDDTRQ